ncbi:MAG: VWA domain-containing protein [Anaerolineae bacterium]|nr:VWA domain-containing protein [Anaerolineae bacterium]
MSDNAEQATPDVAQMEPTQQDVFNKSQDARWWEGGQKVETGAEFAPRKLQTQLDKVTRRQSGRRSRTRTDRKRGRYIKAVPANGRNHDIAFDATLRAAAIHQRARQQQKAETGMAYALRKGDLYRKIRVRRAANLILFVVDASWSMAVSERMQATKGAIMSLLTDAYQRRDRVGLIVFQKDRASVILPPTNSVVLAKDALRNIPVGGKTPLSAGLFLAYDTIKREKASHPDIMPLILLLTDGAGNVSMSVKLSPQEEAHMIARLIKEEEIRTVTINMEHVAFDQGLAAKLADQLGGPCYSLGQLKAETLLQTVRQEINQR